MSILEIWLIVTLVVMIAPGALLMWYLRRLLSKFLFISQNLGDLVEVIQNYHNHLNQLNGMETYHGDETIAFLMKHTNSLLDILDDYKNVYDITIPLWDNEENQEDDDGTTEEEKAPTVAVSQENVFYAGTRRRDS